MNFLAKPLSNICQLIVLLLVSNVTFASLSTEFTPNITKRLNDEQLSGMVWATISDGNISVGSAGLSNVSKLITMTESQKVHVGSVTKTVMAIGVLRLIAEEKLSLSTNVEALLPQLVFKNPWHETHPITVKNLLDHTAGLDNIRMWQFLNTTPTPNTPLENAFPSDNSKLLKIRTKPGSQYSYSNMGYTILAMVIEAVTGARYEHYLDENLLKPLEMANTTFEYVSQAGAYADAGLAMGYFENNVPQVAVPSYLRPAGQLTTTAPDMAKFMRFLLSDGRLGSELFISEELMGMLSYPHDTDAEKAGLQIGHGLALAVRDRHNVVGMCHPGTTIGFRAYLCLFPEQSKAFFYAVNMDSETANYEQFNVLFIQLLSIRKSSIELPDAQVMDMSNLTGVYLPSPNNMAEFEWLDLVFNFKWLKREGNHLIIRSLQGKDRTLIPLNRTLFRATDRTKASHAIIVDEGQFGSLSDGLSTFKKQSTFKIVGYWLSLILGVLGFVYIAVVGLIRVLARNTEKPKIISWPFFNIIGFSIPILLYYNQSLFKFGELTAASVLLALASGLLPLTLLAAVFLGLRRLKIPAVKRDIFACVMLFQLCLVLLFWNVIPVVFWK